MTKLAMRQLAQEAMLAYLANGGTIHRLPDGPRPIPLRPLSLRELLRAELARRALAAGIGA